MKRFTSNTKFERKKRGNPLYLLQTKSTRNGKTKDSNFQIKLAGNVLLRRHESPRAKWWREPMAQNWPPYHSSYRHTETWRNEITSSNCESRSADRVAERGGERERERERKERKKKRKKRKKGKKKPKVHPAPDSFE